MSLNNNLKIIAIVGLIGSGKTSAVSWFVGRGFKRVGFNDVVIKDEMPRRRLAVNEKNERMVREELRRDEGMAVMAVRSLPKVEAALAHGKNVVVESLYSWSEYKVMKEKFGERFLVCAVHAPPEIRYARLKDRAIRPLTHEEALSRDYAEIEHLEKAGPIVMANWTIVNTGAKEEFLKAIDGVIDTVIKHK